MPLEIVTVPCLSDNYAFLLHDAATGATAVVDVPEAAPIHAELNRRNWTLTDILITHHHWDHIDGVQDFMPDPDIAVSGNASDAKRLPPLTRRLNPGDAVTIGSQTGTVIEVSGHTIGDIAYHFAASNAVFTADSLMALGCGRIFEGSPQQMFESLGRLAALPPETLIYSGHEYTAANAKFALTIEPENPDLISRVEAITAARAAGHPTVPSTLHEELATNPFLRCHSSAIKTRLNMFDATGAEVFAKIRALKNKF